MRYFLTGLELTDHTTALLIYWRMWWHDPLPRLPRPHPFVDFFALRLSKPSHFVVWGPRGGASDPKFELGRHFYSASNHQVSLSYV